MGKKLGLRMRTTGLIIDLASILLEVDFRSTGRNLSLFCDAISEQDFRDFLNRRGDLCLL